jgi:hypothetical protein
LAASCPDAVETTIRPPTRLKRPGFEIMQKV